ncbi:hypothetical protein B0I33_105284 [Prauserella shujinwangii]|uniref:DUF222 domain-containing protein n=2 Tax=Prauserella shujinwangii TaxID=1453103 RepID=A0A2T0LV50_9PSEU|nr:hypothetical protein B0I33_105284 [Prauserella shujinwangii]
MTEGSGDAELLTSILEHHLAIRRLEDLRLALIAEIDREGVARQAGYPGTVELVMDLLLLDRRQARRVVAEARDRAPLGAEHRGTSGRDP